MSPGKQTALSNNLDGRLLDLVEMANAHIRDKVEHLFRVVKEQFGFRKTRLRAMAMNHCKVNMLAALTSLYIARCYLLNTGLIHNWCI